MGLNDGTTPLMAAAGVGWKVAAYTRRDNATPGSVPPPADDDRTLEAVMVALDHGADVNASNESGDTALHGAANGGYAEVIQLLVDKGAKLNAKNRAGRTPLNLAKVDREGTKGRHDVKNAELLLRKLGAQDEASKYDATYRPSHRTVCNELPFEVAWVRFTGTITALHAHKAGYPARDT